MSKEAQTEDKILEAKNERQLQTFYFPEYDIRVHAASEKEAKAIVRKQIKEGK